MDVRDRWPRDRGLGRRNWPLLLIPLALIVLITVVGIRSPADVHLGPLLVIAPAVTLSFAGPKTTAAIGALAVAAHVIIAVFHGGLTTSNHVAQIGGLAVLSALIVLFAVVRDRHSRQLARAQSVAEAAQQALLRPLPERIGPLQIATVYLAAEDETHIGGDLFTATRTDATGADAGTRIMIGDVRGKGLAAVGEAALLLRAFRLVAASCRDLADLAGILDRHVDRYLVDFADSGDETGEHFVTALLLEIPDDGPVARLTNCGHPPPLVLRADGVTPLDGAEPAPPLGVQSRVGGAHTDWAFPFLGDDTLLLYTDGVTEARNGDGTFYPLPERAARWTAATPEALVEHLRRDLLAYCGGRLGDDAALLAVRRASTPAADEPPASSVGDGAEA
ncbi:PP2C family protein-serine/threonine phosphatase [Streptacidiphilus anmyonensis]|uniref:PP2C family protein-serine/threonine phosphatase n=1 Tax=Streptacidiphilus anmyonensis TaxID=405782 RepID=UPI0005A932FD|nr:PP2C family protein-serine/threonine phosphatase [Streptacidiphilus anmyonensis]